MKLQELKKLHEQVCNEYIAKFEKKHGYKFSEWIGDMGMVADFIGQYAFNMDDIIFDINTRQPKNLIFQWQDDYIEHNMNKEFPDGINFKSYSMGLRFKDI